MNDLYAIDMEQTDASVDKPQKISPVIDAHSDVSIESVHLNE